MLHIHFFCEPHKGQRTALEVCCNFIPSYEGSYRLNHTFQFHFLEGYFQWALDFSSLSFMKGRTPTYPPYPSFFTSMRTATMLKDLSAHGLFVAQAPTGSPVRCGTNPGLELLPMSTGNRVGCAVSKPQNPTCFVQHKLSSSHANEYSTHKLQLYRCIPSVNLLYSEVLRFLLGMWKLGHSQPDGFHPDLDPSKVCWGLSSARCSSPHSSAGAGWAKTKALRVVLDCVTLSVASRELSLFSWAADAHPFPLLRKFQPLLVGKLSFPTTVISWTQPALLPRPITVCWLTSMKFTTLIPMTSVKNRTNFLFHHCQWVLT